MPKRTMRAFDEMYLTPVEEMTPEEIRELRLREYASQAVFARYLNVTTSLVSQWERGEKRPQGASLKLLTLVAKNGLGAVARRRASSPSRFAWIATLPGLSPNRCPYHDRRIDGSRSRGTCFLPHPGPNIWLLPPV